MSPSRSDELLARARAASLRKALPSDPLPPGYEQVTIPIPVQPIEDAFPAGRQIRDIEIGRVKLCPRCGGRAGKRSRALGYFPDPSLQHDRDRNIIRCRRCNGHGIVPNIGI